MSPEHRISLGPATSQRFSLSWQNVSVIVLESSKPPKRRRILENVSGCAKSGSLVAIMGPSGSGKTTFLTAVSGRFRDKTGTIKLNSTVVSDDTVRKVSAFVYQQDIFTESLKVHEHLSFMAALKLGEKGKTGGQIVEKLLADLGLETQRGSPIGDLSGGEKRRLSLAAELISDPMILFCDEPTTGLDSCSAVSVVQKLQSVALAGKLVLVSIHQPSSQLFHYFDNITLLADGKLVFQGTREEAECFFKSSGLVCPAAYNPAEFYISCLGRIREKFKPEISEVEEEIADDVLEAGTVRNRFFYELRWLLWRRYLEINRNKVLHLGGLLSLMLEMIAIAQFFSQVTLSSANCVRDVEGVLSFISTELTFTTMYAVICVFPDELPVFLREKDLYSLSSYYLSKIVALVPLCLISTIVYISIFFAMLEIMEGWYLWAKLVFVMFVIAMSGTSLGLAISAVFPTVVMMEAILAPVEVLLMLMSGFFVKLSTIPKALGFLRYLSPFYYGFDAVSVAFWTGTTATGNCTGMHEVFEEFGLSDTIFYDMLFALVLTIGLWIMGLAGIVRKKILYSI